MDKRCDNGSEKVWEESEREAAGLSLSRQDVSEICNMHEGYVKQIETGSKLPALPLLLKICETLHTSPNYLFEFSEDKDVQDVLELLYTLTPDQLKAVKHMISSYLEFKEKWKNKMRD
ncbi:helix-turn-helix domain-containing protein [Blautia intestinalis]|uniref:helix-turn-helix domain-containing protein n=1 Tax=Blautia intestinalis TaxID=2763028 RepID=UPI0022E977E9|nr:helix-turn-helix transcriptional regulator [Blautia intestinalis]